jgi:hypothetical protein
MEHDNRDEVEAEDLTDPEGPDKSDMDDPDGPPLIECPYCHKMIHEDSEWCHLCGNYLSEEEAANAVPMWILIGTVLGILGLLGGVLLWMFT